jgi:succinate dehydrogenase / fumarate reductase cytochrome b subunit
MDGHVVKSLLGSTVGKKIIIALTGVALILFVIAHLAGNLTLVFGGAEAFNSYSHKLISLGPLLYLVEFFLAAFFIFHFTLAIITTLKNRGARSQNYVILKSAGRVSKKSLSSTTMIYSGIIILTFLIVHLITFKYGPGISEGYVMTLDNEPVRDLFRLVVEKFQIEWYAGWYILSMVLLGIHLRHGFWSALQSLGINNPAATRFLYRLGLVVAVILAFGFLFIPVYVYFVY